MLACSAPDDTHKRPGEANRIAEWVPFDYRQHSQAIEENKDSLACQTCLYDQLSYKLNYEATYNRLFGEEPYLDSCWVNVQISSKSSGEILDSIRMETMYLYNPFPECVDVVSLITGFDNVINKVDNYYGEFVVAELNFDGREDFAIIRDEGFG
jgi:hypothetical protein